MQRRSFIDMLELRDKLHFHRGGDKASKVTMVMPTMAMTLVMTQAGSNSSVASEDAQAQAMVASFCGRSFDDGETNEIAQRIRRATANINLEIEALMEYLTHKGNL